MGKAGFLDKRILGTSEFRNGKLGPPGPFSQPLKCPECMSKKVWRDGMRHTRHGDIQRYLCRSCGFRFSESTSQLEVKINVSRQFIEMPNSKHELSHSQILSRDSIDKKTIDDFPFFRSEETSAHFASNVTEPETLNILRYKGSNAKVCVSDSEAKNLAETQGTRQKWAAGATETKPTEADVKGKIIDFGWQLKKNGYSEGTIKQYMWILGYLVKLGSDIFNPDSVKESIAQQSAWSQARRRTVVAAYTKFLEVYGTAWEPPRCIVTRKLPFIPTEKEIDMLISACGKKTATFLQLLKETAMRSGEANRIKWSSIDFERKTITLNDPEKNSQPRIFKVSSNLINMLNALPKINKAVFASSLATRKSAFFHTRKVAARKLQNPRLLQISFHTFRHWKATMLYHQTKDVLFVKEFLGHKRIDTTLLYIQLDKVLFNEASDEFTAKVAKDSEEIKQLLEVGFEYVCEKDGLMFFRKRK